MERLEWYRRALRMHKIKIHDSLITSTDLTSTGGYQAAIELLSLPDPPDAILCINDETAFGVLHAAHRRGLKIGRQLAVAGFDGVQDARHTEPPLTTLDIPVYDIARQLVSVLLSSIRGDAVESPQLVKPKLLIRPSTGG
jgi:LacI family transcriptional regulator